MPLVLECQAQEITKNCYDRPGVPHMVEDDCRIFWHENRGVIRDFADTVKRTGGRLVLDVGSGPGNASRMLANEGLEVVCLDLAYSMVHTTQNRRHLTSVQGDFLHLPFHDSSFSGVWAYTSLIHAPKRDFPYALNEVSRVLKHGGIFGLGVIHGIGEKPSRAYGAERWIARYTREEIMGYLDGEFSPYLWQEIQPGPSRYLTTIAKKIG